MRDYGLVSGTFWTGETGRAIRGDAVTQLVAAYLITAPTSNMIGLYYLPIVVIAHEVGCPSEGASKALRRLSEVGFCQYDHDSEVVFVCQMAERQLGKTIKQKDKRHKTIVKLWNAHQKSQLYACFYEKYKAAFSLPEPVQTEATSKPLRSPFEAPSKPGSGEGTGTGEGTGSFDSASSADSPPPDTKPKRERKPRERDPLFDSVARAAALDPTTAGASIGKVCRTLRSAETPYTDADVDRFAREFHTHCPHAKDNGRTIPTLGEIEKYIGRIRAPRPPATQRNGRWHGPPDRWAGFNQRSIVAGVDPAEATPAAAVGNADGTPGQNADTPGTEDVPF